MKYAYLVVEGYHDVAFIGKLLSDMRIPIVTKMSSLDPYWTRMIPDKFPPQDDLLKRIDMPVFFQNETHSVAIHSSGGDFRKIAGKLEATLFNYDTLVEKAVGIAIFLDADYGVNGAMGRFSDLLGILNTELRWPNAPGGVLKDKPNTGIFIFPDNESDGTVESILLKCAKSTYADLHDGADHFISNINLSLLKKKDKQELLKPSGKNKAVVGCIANVLRPGKTIQVSIQDNRWICRGTLCLEEMKLLNGFLKEILDM